MIIYLPYDAPNWNDYINIERTNKYKANKLKQEEKAIINYYCKGKEYTGYYPVELIIKAHFNSRRKDLDNVYFLGRLGDYKYYDMDKAIARAIELFEEIK